MAKTVIALSRTLGAGGEELGAELARELGFEYVDSEIISRAAERAGVSTDVVAQTEARKPFIARILENLARGSAGVMAAEAPEMAVYLSEGSESYEGIITEVIRQVAARGKVVIVAHGASIPLAGTPGLLRVLVTASPDVRAGRVAAQQDSDSGKAARAVADSDKARADYFRRFYHLQEEMATSYDMVVNTDVLDVPSATRAILAVARS